LSFLRAYGLEGFPEPHDRADEFFRIIIDIPIVMLMTGHRHRLDKTYPEVIDKARLGLGHVRDERLENSLVCQNTPFKIGRLRRAWRVRCHGRHGLSRPRCIIVLKRSFNWGLSGILSTEFCHSPFFSRFACARASFTFVYLKSR